MCNAEFLKHKQKKSKIRNFFHFLFFFNFFYLPILNNFRIFSCFYFVVRKKMTTTIFKCHGICEFYSMQSTWQHLFRTKFKFQRFIKHFDHFDHIIISINYVQLIYINILYRLFLILLNSYCCYMERLSILLSTKTFILLLFFSN